MMQFENLKNGGHSSWPTEDSQRENSFEFVSARAPLKVNVNLY